MKSIIITLVCKGLHCLEHDGIKRRVCAAGACRAGCVGVRGAAVVHRPVVGRHAVVIRR